MIVTVKPNKKENKIISQTKDEMVVEIKAPAKDNKANLELIKFLKSQGIHLRIKSGFKSKKKILV